ncbi:hypothetical protein LUZ62_038441 [Rhynchospora pubera]|uniref:Uncharacterized protein n=1 Tax=Rhynchospora pubera TaxID=906938 RepID=A0AAV8F4D4_9POAL|nr:hypothetical protein LUZ62_038441 [Rhynchospora pubera]
MDCYYERRQHSSCLDFFTLTPLPYPVILILVIVLLLIVISWFFTIGDFIQAAIEKINLALLAVPLILIFLIRFLSLFESFDRVLDFYRTNRQHIMNYDQLNDGGLSPCGMVALVVLILILAFFHSTFQVI